MPVIVPFGLIPRACVSGSVGASKLLYLLPSAGPTKPCSTPLLSSQNPVMVWLLLIPNAIVSVLFFTMGSVYSVPLAMAGAAATRPAAATGGMSAFLVIDIPCCGIDRGFNARTAAESTGASAAAQCPQPTGTWDR